MRFRRSDARLGCASVTPAEDIRRFGGGLPPWSVNKRIRAVFALCLNYRRDSTVTTHTMQPALLRITEAAEYLGVSRTKCYELIQRGELRTLKIDTSVRVPRAELERWLCAELERQGVTGDNGPQAA